MASKWKLAKYAISLISGPFQIFRREARASRAYSVIWPFHTSGKSTKLVGRRLDNAHLKSPKAQKHIDDTSGDLAGMPVKSMVLIPVSCFTFSKKATVD